MRVLIVEDDAGIAAGLLELMGGEGFSATVVMDVAGALAELAVHSFDVVLLDVMLPDGDGFMVVRDMRAHGVATPVLMLTARDAVEDRVKGLDAGADDYLAKPFAVPELLARVRALLRRSSADVADVLAHGGVELNRRSRTARRDGQLLDLTLKELDLLELLLENAGRAVSRETIARVVWHDVPRATPIDNVIEVHMARLRRKLDEPFATRLLHTVRGVGYVLDERSP